MNVVIEARMETLAESQYEGCVWCIQGVVDKATDPCTFHTSLVLRSGQVSPVSSQFDQPKENLTKGN